MLHFIIVHLQGGSIKPLLRPGGRFFRIGIRFENNLKMIVICVILSVGLYGKSTENFIINSAGIAKISIFAQIS